MPSVNSDPLRGGPYGQNISNEELDDEMMANMPDVGMFASGNSGSSEMVYTLVQLPMIRHGIRRGS